MCAIHLQCTRNTKRLKLSRINQINNLRFTSGVLSIALPVPVVVSNFEQFYQKELNRRRQEKDRKDEEKKNEKERKRLQQLGLLEESEEAETMLGERRKTSSYKCLRRNI